MLILNPDALLFHLQRDALIKRQSRHTLLLPSPPQNVTQTFKMPDPLHKVLTSFTVYIQVNGEIAPSCTYKAYVYEWDSPNFRIVGNALFEGPTQLVSSLSTSQMGAVTETIPSVILDPTMVIFSRAQFATPVSHVTKDNILNTLNKVGVNFQRTKKSYALFWFSEPFA